MSLTYLNKINYLNKDEFLNIDKKNQDKIVQNIKSGCIYIVKKAINKKTIRSIVLNIINMDEKINSSPKILEGIKNIYHSAKPKGGTYEAIDQSWYFFPWNEDQTKLSQCLQPFFNQIILLNDYQPDIILKNTPKNEVVQRFHLIYYPEGNGKITKHVDPTYISNVNAGVYVTEFDTDYISGGFYALDKKQNKIFLDHKINSGDLVLFYPNMVHGVDPVICKKNSDNFAGRCFINMQLVQSHEKKNINSRQYTKGIAD